MASNPTLLCFVLIFKDSSGIFKYTYSHEPAYFYQLCLWFFVDCFIYFLTR